MHLRGNQSIKAFLILMFAAFILVGCGGRLFTYKGDKVTQKDLIVQLVDGDQQGAWQTNELLINYQYQSKPDTFKILGTVELVGGFAIGFNYIGDLSVNLLFLDNQGIVMGDDIIYSSGSHYSTNMIPMIFEKTISVPQGANAISFAYKGELGGRYNIWFSPSRQ